QAELDLRYAEERLKRLSCAEEAIAHDILSAALFEASAKKTALERSRASLTTQVARVELLRVRLGERELRAPFDGIVAARYAAAGAVLSSGEKVVRLISTEREVRFAIPNDAALT